MIPVLAVQDSAHLRRTNSEFGSQHSDELTSFGASTPSFRYLVGGELRSSVPLSATKMTTVSLSSDAVLDVVRVGADVEAFQVVDAGRIVTAVKYLLAGLKRAYKVINRPAVRAHVFPTISIMRLRFATREPAVSLSVGPSRPWPAQVGPSGSVHLRPESTLNVVLHHLNVTGRIQ